jgi:hypothetical protein
MKPGREPEQGDPSFVQPVAARSHVCYRSPRLSWRLGAVALAAVVAAAVVLTRPGDGQTAYVHLNRALLASFPVFPGAVQVRRTSFPHDPNCRPHGYTTTVVYRVPTGTRAVAVVSFYATWLGRRGWHGNVRSFPVYGGLARFGKIGKTLHATFERRDARLALGTDDMVVLTDRPLRKQHILWRYEIAVDYRGRQVRCSEGD